MPDAVGVPDAARRLLPRLAGSLLLGLRHGAYCVGCCWALMALLLGVTNLLWMILLSLLVFSEKVTSVGRQVAAVGGIVLVAAGAWLLDRADMNKNIFAPAFRLNEAKAFLAVYVASSSPLHRS
jgi:hypothetical protein